MDYRDFLIFIVLRFLHIGPSEIFISVFWRSLSAKIWLGTFNQLLSLAGIFRPDGPMKTVMKTLM